MMRNLPGSITALVLAISIACCSPRVTPPQVEQHNNTEYINRYLRDTVYEYRSEYIYKTSDTVYCDIQRIVYKERFIRDTVLSEHTDSIPYPVEVPVYIEKKLKPWQTGLMLTGMLAIICLTVFLYLKIRKFFAR